MLFISLFSSSDTWVHSVLLSPNSSLRKRIRNFADTFPKPIDCSRTNRPKVRSFVRLQPDYEDAMATMFIDPNSSSGYQVVRRRSSTFSKDLLEVINDGEVIRLGAAVTADTEGESNPEGST